MDIINMRLVEVCEIYNLRHKLLCPEESLLAVNFIGDDYPTTLHVGLFIGDLLVGCASLMLSSNQTFDFSPQFQLRGMAIEKEYQHKGYGQALIKYCEFLCLNRSTHFLWCNSRVDAQDFYLKAGFTSYGLPFYIPNVCDHILMAKCVKEHICKRAK
ncbi:MAG: GNAT family N-acetyltransferase [Clostridia bacterium]